MANQVDRLSAPGVLRLKKAGYYCDGAGLYLQVSVSGAKSWIYRYKMAGRTREMGLGGLHTVGLAKARKEALAARQLAADSIDPIEHRQTVMQAQAAAAADVARNTITFDQAAVAYINAKEAEWKNGKHVDQWRNTLASYASPVLGSMSVALIKKEHVLRVLEPIWTTKTETANRVRGRLESVLDWAKGRGYRSGDNPAAWAGNLDVDLPAPGKIARVVNHPALPYAQAGAFMTALRAQPGISALLVEFIILTGVRTGEALGARWSEFDLEAARWTVPALRMKMDREHRVPLSPAAILVLRDERLHSESDFVFHSGVAGKPLSNMAGLSLLKRMKRTDITVHGFRSTFRDWAAETTGYPNHVVEMALAHAIGDKVEAAYRRGDLYEKRAHLMSEWATYVSKPSVVANVLPLSSARAMRPSSSARA